MADITENIYTIYLISFLAFAAVILLVEGAYYFWNSLGTEKSQKVSRRFRALSAGGVATKEALSLLNTKQLSSQAWLNQVLVHIPRMHALDRGLEQAGMEISVTRFLMIQLFFSIVFFVVFILVGLALYIAIPISILLAVFICISYVGAKQRRRRKLFTEQLPDTLDYIARSLRAGNPFASSLLAVSKEMPEPTATEFAITFDELNYGLDLGAALHNLGERSNSEEIRYFITAALIQRQTGGNLADVLNRIGKVMRARANTKREIQVLAAEMDLSAKVLIALPFFVAFLFLIINPDYIKTLFEYELGWALIGLQMFLMAIGYGIIKKMINFRV